MAEYTLQTSTIDLESNGNGNGSPKDNGGTSSTTVSIDSLGFLETWSFAWVRLFYAKSPTSNAVTDPENASHAPDVVGKNEADNVTLKLATSDLCETNVDRLLDLYRRDEDIHGKINASILRVCFDLCRNRLLLATGAYLFYLATTMVAITVFLVQVMWAANQHWNSIIDLMQSFYSMDDYGTNETAKAILESGPQGMDKILAHNIFYSIPFVLTMWFGYLQRSFYGSMVLRTGIMVRNACAGAVYVSSLKSSVQSHVASYQIMAFCAEDGDAILELVQKGGLLVGHTIGIVMCMVCGFLLVGFQTIWAAFGVSVMLLVAYLFGMTSNTFFRKSLSFQTQKMTVADEYFHRSATDAFNDVGSETSSSNLLGQREAYRNRFSAAASGQFWALFRAEALRPIFAGAITVGILIGLLAVIAIGRHSMADPETEYVMALSVLFLYLLSMIVADWTDSIMAIIRGIVVLDKVKTFLSRPTPILPVNHPEDVTLKLSMQEATFKWETTIKAALDKQNEQTPIAKPVFSLQVQKFEVKKSSIVGITGEDESGKTSFVLAMLGHMPHRSGDYRRLGGISFYPEKPYVINDATIRENIIFGDEVNAKPNESRYKEAVSTVQLHINQGFDCVPMARHALDDQWLQKISLARAVYEESDNTIILENPLSCLDSSTEISDIFSDVATKLVSMGKTVIVVSQDDNVLRHCQHISLLDRGTVSVDNGTYDKMKSSPVYKEIVRNHRNQREALRNANRSNNLQTMLNLSTEDLVTNEVAATPGLPSMFNWMETLYLILLNFAHTIFQTMLPTAEIMFYVIYDRLLLIMSLISGVILIFGNALVKHYVHRTARRATKRLQRIIFDRMLSSPLAAVNESLGVAGLDAMLESNFRAFGVRANTISSCMLIVFSMFVIALMEGFWCFNGFVMVLEVVVIYYVLRHTTSRVAASESSSRLVLFHHVHNDLGGRVVLQSFGQIGRSRNRIFALIDTHASSVYLHKSIIHCGHFIFTLCQVVNLPFAMVAAYHDRYRDDSSYMISLYLFFLLTHHIYVLLETRLDKIGADRKLQKAHNFKIVTEDTSTLKYT